jgi:hypothetical protein
MNWLQTLRIALPLSRRKSAMVLKSGERRPVRGNRPFRAKSGALILKIHIDQVLAQSLNARKLPNGRALLQAALRAATARNCTKSGKDATPPPHPALRTLHATFAAQGSSLSKPRCQNRRHLEDGTFTMCTCSRRVMQ